MIIVHPIDKERAEVTMTRESNDVQVEWKGGNFVAIRHWIYDRRLGYMFV